MSKKSAKRFAEEQHMKRHKKLILHLEALGAAYAKHCSISPEECALMVEEVPGPVKTLKYWYSKHEPKINDQLAHPHVKFLLNQAHAIAEASKSGNSDMLQTAVEQITKFIGVYNEFDQHVTDKTAIREEVLDAGGQSGGNREDGAGES